MGLLEQAAEARFVLRWAVKSCHEGLPLFVVEYESGLVGQRLLSFFVGATDNKIRDIYTLPFSGDFDEGFFRSGCAKLEAAVARLLWC